MESNCASSVARAAGAPILFTWLVAAGSLGFAQLISGQILIFKLEGSPATLALLGIAVYFAPLVGLAACLAGAGALFYAASHGAPGPWRKLRRATWGLALPAAFVAGLLLFSIAAGTEFNGQAGGSDFGLRTLFVWAPLVVLVVLGFAVLVDAITRSSQPSRGWSLPLVAAGAALAICVAVFVPYFS
ncbi:hypothetical protein [Salinibacterium sp. ZJ454]|uniref:hypothetical protein n=1 Tax=Salinibacterium sp. ZJ454 TaxID=2708339 RepID=UPI00141E9DEC|nr:hypothetical protein [Salinibacterium sp. ZJ454]